MWICLAKKRPDWLAIHDILARLHSALRLNGLRLQNVTRASTRAFIVAAGRNGVDCRAVNAVTRQFCKQASSITRRAQRHIEKIQGELSALATVRFLATVSTCTR